MELAGKGKMKKKTTGGKGIVTEYAKGCLPLAKDSCTEQKYN